MHFLGETCFLLAPSVVVCLSTHACLPPATVQVPHMYVNTWTLLPRSFSSWKCSSPSQWLLLFAGGDYLTLTCTQGQNCVSVTLSLFRKTRKSHQNWLQGGDTNHQRAKTSLTNYLQRQGQGSLKPLIFIIFQSLQKFTFFPHWDGRCQCLGRDERNSGAEITQ